MHEKRRLREKEQGGRITRLKCFPLGGSGDNRSILGKWVSFPPEICTAWWYPSMPAATSEQLRGDSEETSLTCQRKQRGIAARSRKGDQTGGRVSNRMGKDDAGSFDRWRKITVSRSKINKLKQICPHKSGGSLMPSVSCPSLLRVQDPRLPFSARVPESTKRNLYRGRYHRAWAITLSKARKNHDPSRNV